jgi:hypothetical protein
VCVIAGHLIKGQAFPLVLVPSLHIRIRRIEASSFVVAVIARSTHYSSCRTLTPRTRSSRRRFRKSSSGGRTRDGGIQGGRSQQRISCPRGAISRSRTRAIISRRSCGKLLRAASRYDGQSGFSKRELTVCRTTMSALHTVVSILLWLRRWRSTWILSMFLDGKHRRQLHRPTSQVQI